METTDKIKKLLTLDKSELDEDDRKELEDLLKRDHLWFQDTNHVEEMFKKHFIDFDRAKQENKSLSDFKK
jgi:hypothetical protein